MAFSDEVLQSRKPLKSSLWERANIHEKQVVVSNEGELHLFRILLISNFHAEKVENNSGENNYGEQWVQLSDRGKKEALIVSKKLKEFYKDHPYPDKSEEKPLKPLRILWHSPNARSREGAKIIMSECSDLFTENKENILLCAQQFGLFEGLHRENIETTYPNEWKLFKKQIDFGGRYWARPPLGESRADVSERVNLFFDSLLMDKQMYGVTDVAILTHGVTFRVFNMMALQRNPEWLEVEPMPLCGAIRVLDGNIDKGYVFNGFSRKLESEPKHVHLEEEQKEDAEEEERAGGVAIASVPTFHQGKECPYKRRVPCPNIHLRNVQEI